MRETTVRPLCYIFSNGGHVFQRINNPHIVCRIPQGTYITNLVPIGQVVSEEKSFEKLITTTDDVDGRLKLLVEQ